jgi:hypothetical protein
VTAVEKCSGSDGQSFVQFMKNYDKIRKENFMQTHTEIAVAMNFN